MIASPLILGEPELEFAGGQRHEDIRFGLMNFGPIVDSSRSRQIRVGIVGTGESVAKLRTWLDVCAAGIPAKKSHHTNLFPSFPGFRQDSCFGLECVFPSSLTCQISDQIFKTAMLGTSNSIVADAVAAFESELAALDAKDKPDVVLCAIPSTLLEPTTGSQAAQTTDPILNFRGLLKAKAMRFRFPIQIALPATYDGKGRRAIVGARPGTYEDQGVQDDATRAWNFFVALLYKAGICPWRLARDSHDLQTCFVGISFYHAIETTRVVTSMAQVFNERGEGMIVRGDPVELSKDDPQPHLTRQDAEKLLTHALTKYRDEHKHVPARVVVHKTSTFNDNETAGCREAAKTMGIGLVDLVSIAKSSVRLFRDGFYPPLRGTYLALDDRNHLLYTRGSSPFYQTYTGMYVPRPLLLRTAFREQSPEQLSAEIIALTKLNWNSSQIDGSLPITIRAARRVGDILKYVPEHEIPRAHYSYYM